MPLLSYGENQSNRTINNHYKRRNRMRNIKVGLCLSLGILALPNLSYAGIGEGNWEILKGETIIKDFSKSPQGVEYGCEEFSPSKVSFIIKYNYPYDSKFPINVIADKKEKVVHDKISHIITVSDATSLDIQLPAYGRYEITNNTGTKIEGISCDTGFYG
jgi:hypothetical protein